MRADAFSPDTQEFLRLLSKHSVRYVIIGGVAVIYHGYPRMTGDADFFYDRTADNAARLWEVLSEFWDGAVPGITGPDELNDASLIVQFGRPPNRIDLISNLDPVSFEDAWQHRVTESIEVHGAATPVWILGLNQLRIAKRTAGRPKDLDDLEHLQDS